MSEEYKTIAVDEMSWLAIRSALIVSYGNLCVPTWDELDEEMTIIKGRS